MSKHTTITCDVCSFTNDADERWHEAPIGGKTYDLCNNCFERAIVEAVNAKQVLPPPPKKPPYRAPDQPITPLPDFNASPIKIRS